MRTMFVREACEGGRGDSRYVVPLSVVNTTDKIDVTKPKKIKR